MAEYRHSAHAEHDIKYHVIWVTKHRHKVMRGRVAELARELIRQICPARGVIIIRGAISPDHIHMLLSAPPHLAPAKLVQYVKGRSSSLEPAFSRGFLGRPRARLSVAKESTAYSGATCPLIPIEVVRKRQFIPTTTVRVFFRRSRSV